MILRDLKVLQPTGKRKWMRKKTSSRNNNNNSAHEHNGNKWLARKPLATTEFQVCHKPNSRFALLCVMAAYRIPFVLFIFCPNSQSFLINQIDGSGLVTKRHTEFQTINKTTRKKTYELNLPSINLGTMSKCKVEVIAVSHSFAMCGRYNRIARLLTIKLVWICLLLLFFCLFPLINSSLNFRVFKHLNDVQ